MSGLQTSSPAPRIVRLDAAAAFDAAGVALAPAALLLERTPRAPRPGDDLLPPGVPVGQVRILAADTPQALDHHPANAQATRVSRPDSILLPGLVNAHTHLDLTHLGPTPPCDFPAFVDRVRAGRASTEDGIAAAVRTGVALCLQGGVVAVGDIAGAHHGRPSLAAFRALRETPLAGISFLEFFAIGTGERRALDVIETTFAEARATLAPNRVRPGLQPHAPYSVSPAGFDAAATLAERWNVPLSTHLAESPAERRFVTFGDGPQVDLLRAVGVWDDAIRDWAGRGRSPVDLAEPFLRRVPALAVHLNDLDDRDVERLARSKATAVYCPRSSAFFRAESYFGRHRLPDLIAAGVRTVLGTDSIMNLPAQVVAPGGPGLGVLGEVAELLRRGWATPAQALAMVTTHAAEALGLDSAHFALNSGARPLAVVALQLPTPRASSAADAFAAALAAQPKTELLFFGN